MKQVNIRISEDLKKRLQLMCFHDGITINEALTDAIMRDVICFEEDYVDQIKKTGNYEPTKREHINAMSIYKEEVPKKKTETSQWIAPWDE